MVRLRFLTITAMAMGFAWLGACAYLPTPPPPLDKTEEGQVQLGQGWIERKQTIQALGQFDGGKFVPRVLRLKKEDKEVSVKGPLGTLEPGTLVTVGAAAFAFNEESKLEREDGRPAEASEFPPGTWVKADGIFRDNQLLLRKLVLRERKEREEEEIRGPIASVDQEELNFVIGDVAIDFDAATPVTWDVKGVDPPPQERRWRGSQDDRTSGIRRVRRIRPEDARPDEQYSPFEGLVIGGEVKYRAEWRNNFDLEVDNHTDLLLHQAQLTLEASATISKNLYAFFKLYTGPQFIQKDEAGTLRQPDIPLELNEAWLLLEDLPFPGISFEIGRQDIDDGMRAWVTNDQIEAARIWINLNPAELEFSVSQRFFEVTRREKEVVNYFAALHLRPIRKTEFIAYAFHQENGKDPDYDRYHYGIGGQGRIGDYRWWFDGAYMAGEEDTRDVKGFGFDVMNSFIFKDLPLQPYLTAGFAFGDGDADPFSDGDGNFRQTGLHDNKDRFFDVFSFRYLGELSRFDLSNIAIFTAGLGFRPLENASLGFVYHYYRQEVPAFFTGRTRLLKAFPSGASKDLGHELDLILGVYTLKPLQFQFVFGWFMPGEAYRPGVFDAFYGAFEMKYIF